MNAWKIDRNTLLLLDFDSRFGILVAVNLSGAGQPQTKIR